MKYIYITLALCLLALPALAQIDRIDTGITDVVSDTTPQAGGDFDLNGNELVDDSLSISYTSGGGLIGPLPSRAVITSASYTLSAATDAGNVLYFSAGSGTGPNTTITFSSGGNFSPSGPSLQDTLMIINEGTGSILFQSNGNETLKWAGGASSGLTTQYNQAGIIAYDSATFYIGGGVE